MGHRDVPAQRSVFTNQLMQIYDDGGNITDMTAHNKCRGYVRRDGQVQSLSPSGVRSKCRVDLLRFLPRYCISDPVTEDKTDVFGIIDRNTIIIGSNGITVFIVVAVLIKSYKE